MRVDLIDGRNIHGIDRGGTMATLRKGAVTLMLATTGKSDPFVVFHLNGQRVYKSQTKKKTLNPEWNENFTVQVVCRSPSI